MKKIIFSILLIINILIFILHLMRINASTTQIDHLEFALKPIKPYLINKKNISVIYDTTDIALYYHIQLVLAPIILETEIINTDTILVINKKNNNTNINQNNYNILKKNNSNNFNIILYSKKY